MNIYVCVCVCVYAMDRVRALKFVVIDIKFYCFYK